MYVLMIWLLAVVVFLYIERRYFKLQADYLGKLANKRAAVLIQERRSREFLRCSVVGVWLELDASEDINRKVKNNEVADVYAKCRGLISTVLKEDICLVEGEGLM